MLPQIFDQYEEIWVCDFEFHASPGELPKPICMVAMEARTKNTIRLWQNDLETLDKAPFTVSENSLAVAYYASAEIGCFLTLNWPLPRRILDLCIEFKCMTSGITVPCGKGLIGAATVFGLNGMVAQEKEGMRNLALRGDPYSDEERCALLDYCESDVRVTCNLFFEMAAKIDLPRALLRGRYMVSVAQIERNGVPIDTQSHQLMNRKWESIKERLVKKIDPKEEIYEGNTFKLERFSHWLVKNGIPWPRHETGSLDLSDDTFKEMARSYPLVAPIRELRYTLSQLRLSSLAIGSDGRNRVLLSAFQSKTGRNQPSNSQYIFGPSCWLRSLIKPPEGHALAYIDWSQQEFGIAAALSQDEKMMEAYQSGDPYLAFAKQAEAVPPDATKKSHGSVRDLFKACVLAVQYGMGENSLAIRINQPTAKARELLNLHRKTYCRFWEWSDRAVDFAMLYGHLYTVFNWQVQLDQKPNARSLRNFPMQANGAEMLRMACCFCTENGIKVCAPVHDALLIEAPIHEIDSAVWKTQQYMVKASRLILDGFELRSDANIVRFPDRYKDERGIKMWETITQLIQDSHQEPEQSNAHS